MKNLGKFNGRYYPYIDVATAIFYYLCFVLVANLSRIKFKSLQINRLIAIFCAQNRTRTCTPRSTRT